MAKARVSTNPMYTGGAGGYSFYVRKSEQIVRQRKNNSNYGESASRTAAQMERRVRWANLVNFYKSIADWQPKAYETKLKGQTDYNIFMSLNINKCPVALTKDMALNGCACVYSYQVTRGSLPPIAAAAVAPAGTFGVEIFLSQSITTNTTIAAFAADVIANNPTFKAGDNLVFLVFKDWQVGARYPFTSNSYYEIPLDTTDTRKLSEVIGGYTFAAHTQAGETYLTVALGAAGSHESGFVFIHTRKVNGSLLVSSQSIRITGEYIYSQYVGSDWVEQCIDTYGMDRDVPLDPGSGEYVGKELLLRAGTAAGDPVQCVVNEKGQLIVFEDSVDLTCLYYDNNGDFQGNLNADDFIGENHWQTYLIVPDEQVVGRLVFTYAGVQYIVNYNDHEISPAITHTYA